MHKCIKTDRKTTNSYNFYCQVNFFAGLPRKAANRLKKFIKTYN